MKQFVKHFATISPDLLEERINEYAKTNKLHIRGIAGLNSNSVIVLFEEKEKCHA